MCGHEGDNRIHVRSLSEAPAIDFLHHWIVLRTGKGLEYRVSDNERWDLDREVSRQLSASAHVGQDLRAYVEDPWREVQAVAKGFDSCKERAAVHGYPDVSELCVAFDAA